MGWLQECSWRGISMMSRFAGWGLVKKLQSEEDSRDNIRAQFFCPVTWIFAFWQQRSSLAPSGNTTKIHAWLLTWILFELIYSLFHASALKLIIGWLSCVTYYKLWILIYKRISRYQVIFYLNGEEIGTWVVHYQGLGENMKDPCNLDSGNWLDFRNLGLLSSNERQGRIRWRKTKMLQGLAPARPFFIGEEWGVW